MESTGQKSTVWDKWWGSISPLSEIRMWDYYGGRQWITKYAPRFGKIIEAGCGVGRYVFYLRQLGIDIEGVDFSDAVIEKLNQTKGEIDEGAVFIKGDVTQLPYADNSLSGYISLGVVEHFIEGPHKAIAEAYRVLRPGGVAIITTPNKSFYVRYRNRVQQIKRLVKKAIGRRDPDTTFFQYEYTPHALRKFCEKEGFRVTRATGYDLLYPFNEVGHFSGKNLKPGGFAYWFANTFENSFLNYVGGQSVTISVKTAPLMHCFLTGKLEATPDSLDKFDVPVSKAVQDSPLAKLFLRRNKVKYSKPYSINPPVLTPETRICQVTGKPYQTHPVFEDYGFSFNIHPELLRDLENNILLTANKIKPIWRKRINS